jgi:hypothetical protein
LPLALGSLSRTSARWEARRTRIKRRLIDVAVQRAGIRSVADLGGVWAVDGKYLFHALDSGPMDRAVMVDTHPSEAFLARARAYPQLEVIEGNFGDRATAVRVGPTDAVILFDVLLHQVRPDWDEVLEMYARQTRCLIVFNQMWTGGPRTVRLLDLGRDEYLRNVPASEFHEEALDRLDEIAIDHGRPWRDVHHIWQWGIVRSDLESRVADLGFEQMHHRSAGRFAGLPHVDEHGWVWVRARAGRS